MASYIAWVGFFVSTFSFVVVLFRWLEERRKSRSEQSRRETAESELKQIRARAEAPYLVAASIWANGVEHSHEVQLRGPGGGLMVAGDRRKQFGAGVQIAPLPAAGATVTILLKNQGQTVRGAAVQNGEVKLVCRLGRLYADAEEPYPKAQHTLPRLKYRFEPAKVGKNCRFELYFESESGMKQTHTYEYIHGVCSLTRIAPQ